jgi:hypothetical protein
MRAGAGKAEVLIEPMKPHLNSAGAHAGIALAVDDMVGRVRIADGLQRHQGIAQFGAKPNSAATVLALAGLVRQVQGVADESVTIDQRAIAISLARSPARIDSSLRLQPRT